LTLNSNKAYRLGERRPRQALNKVNNAHKHLTNYKNISHKSQYPASSRNFTPQENMCKGNVSILLEIQPHATGPT